MLDDEIGRRDCQRHGETEVCVSHLPTVATHSPGQRRISVRKISREPATVRFKTRFEAV